MTLGAVSPASTRAKTKGVGFWKRNSGHRAGGSDLDSIPVSRRRKRNQECLITPYNFATFAGSVLLGFLVVRGIGGGQSTGRHLLPLSGEGEDSLRKVAEESGEGGWSLSEQGASGGENLTLDRGEAGSGKDTETSGGGLDLPEPASPTWLNDFIFGTTGGIVEGGLFDKWRLGRASRQLQLAARKLVLANRAQFRQLPADPIFTHDDQESENKATQKRRLETTASNEDNPRHFWNALFKKALRKEQKELEQAPALGARPIPSGKLNRPRYSRSPKVPRRKEDKENTPPDNGLGQDANLSSTAEFEKSHSGSMCVEFKPADRKLLRKAQHDRLKLEDSPQSDEDEAQIPSWCPKLDENRLEPCVWGRGLTRARLMVPASFFILTSTPEVRCYARATGPGIILPGITVLPEGLLRVDYVAQQEGEYKFWIMCTSVVNQKARKAPSEAVMLPWLHHLLTKASPHELLVEPDPAAPPRGCGACQRATLGTMPGQWVRWDVLECECGREALGSIEDWFVDDYVWAPRTCLVPFRSRAAFSGSFSGRSIALVGDASVRGHFVDLVNWLQGIGPEILQDSRGYSLDSSTRKSTWDGWVAGFNSAPYTPDTDLVLPNPAYMGGVKVAYYEAEQIEDYLPALNRAIQGQPPAFPKLYQQQERGHLAPNSTEPSQPYDILIFSYGIWFNSESAAPEKYEDDWRIAFAVRDILGRLTCGNQEGSRTKCLEGEKPFRGRLLYRSNTGRFDVENFCMRPNELAPPGYGKACSINSQVAAAMQTLEYTTGVEGDFLVLDALNVTFSRPDRSIDGSTFFPRKCGVREYSCKTGTKTEIQDCCWAANLFPHVGSLTLTNMLVNMLWDDPAVGRPEGTSIVDGVNDTQTEESSSTRLDSSHFLNESSQVHMLTVVEDEVSLLEDLDSDGLEIAIQGESTLHDETLNKELALRGANADAKGVPTNSNSSSSGASVSKERVQSSHRRRQIPNDERQRGNTNNI